MRQRDPPGQETLRNQTVCAMSLQQQVIVRHRAPGHLRLQLPRVICTPECSYLLVKGLQAMEGVYRVHFEEKRGKLSIHYLETVCTRGEVATRLHKLIDILPVAISADGERSSPPAPGWMDEKMAEVRETWQATGVIVRQVVRASGGFPRATWFNDFLNDLLMLYLIKMHWPSITQFWLPHPWRYRYEWMATFYLIYLQVKSRLPKPS